MRPLHALQNRAATDPNLRDIVDMLAKYGIPASSCGLIGSTLIPFDLQHFHDYDFVVYGEHNVPRIRTLLSDTALLAMPQAAVERLAVETGLQNNPIGYDHVLRVARRRQAFTAIYAGVEFSFKFARAYGIQEDYHPLPAEGLIRLQGTVVDDSQSYFTPYTYVVSTHLGAFRVSTYSFAFIHSSRRGERVTVFGTKRRGALLVTLDTPYHFIVSDDAPND